MTAIVPPIVHQVQSAFLANVRSGLATTPYLHPSGRAEVEDLLSSGAGSRVVADRLSVNLLEHWADQSSLQHGGEKIGYRRFGAERLFEAFPGAKIYQGLFDPRDFLSEASALPEASNCVLEITYHDSYYANLVSWAVVSCEGLQENMDLQGLHFFHRTGEKRTTLRVPTPSLMELSLRYCFGESGLKLCEAPGIIHPGENNELHKARRHPYGIPLDRSDIHISRDQHPALLGLHDGFHATTASATLQPQFIEVAGLLYDALAQTLEGVEWEAFQQDCDRLQDLNISPSVFRAFFRSLSGRLPSDRIDLLVSHFAALIRGRFPKPALRETDVKDLLRFLTAFRREELTAVRR